MFEGDERTQLLSQFRESFNQREGQLLDAEDELWRQFTRLIQRHLHVIFTMNPANSDFANRCTASPALFNRCVVDWFGEYTCTCSASCWHLRCCCCCCCLLGMNGYSIGTWSPEALAQVGHEFTQTLDTSFTKYQAPSGVGSSSARSRGGRSDTVLETLYIVFESVQRHQQQLKGSLSRSVTTSRSQQTTSRANVEAEPSLREAVVAALVSFHNTVKTVASKLAKSSGQEHFLSPRYGTLHDPFVLIVLLVAADCCTHALFQYVHFFVLF